MNKWLLIGCVVFFAFALRLWNLNAAGQTWDEFSQLDTGYKYIEFILHGDFSDPFWTDFPDQPPLARYFYGLAANFDIANISPNGQITYQYDWTNSRLISILFSTATIFLTIIIGWEYISFFTGTVAGLILSILPIFLGLSQLVTLESVFTFFFTAGIYVFLKYLKNRTTRAMIFTGIISGLAVSTKLTDILLLPIYATIIFIFKFYNKNISLKKYIMPMLLITAITFVVFFISWPALWFNTILVWQKTVSFRFGPADSTELFFGRNITSPLWYFFFYFLVTTPLLVVILFLIGLVQGYRKRNFFLSTLFVWFLFPFIQSFYHDRTNGIRYIVEVYVPMSLFVAFGIESLTKKLNKKIEIRASIVTILVIYLLVVDASITPYYLSYFNQLVGGTENVYQHKWFPLGWWGEGQREASYYLAENGFPGMTIGLQLIPKYVIPIIQGAQYEYYNPKHKYDYIIVNYLSDIRDNFNEDSLKNNYKLVYQTLAAGAPIVDVYKHK